MDDAGGKKTVKSKMKGRASDEEDSGDEVWNSDDDDETIARVQRAHYAQTAAMNARRRAPPRARPMSHKRKMEAVKTFHDFTKKLKKDTGISIRGLVGNNILELSDFSSETSESESDGLPEEEFVVNPTAVQELEENESYIDPETGDFVQGKKEETTSQPSIKEPVTDPPPEAQEPEEKVSDEPKTMSISDIINDSELDLSKNVEIAEVEGSELGVEKTPEELLDIKQEDNSQDFDITEKLKEMGEISVKSLGGKEDEEEKSEGEKNLENENEDEKKPPLNANTLNVRRNIREVMDEKNLDASTLAAQRQESERLARVQEQQRIIREVQRQIAMNRQNKIHQKTLSLLQGGSSILKKSSTGQKLNLPNTVLVKLPSGELKKTTLKQGQVEVTKVPKPTTSGAQKPYQKTDKKEGQLTLKEQLRALQARTAQRPPVNTRAVVEIVDSSSGEESSSSSSDSDDCIMLSDSEVPPSPEADEDPNNSGLHVNDAYNVPDEQGRVQINVGHPDSEEDIFLAPQIARVIKPHQVGGVRFLFDNIIESTQRFSTSTGFGCILAHSMGLGKTLQIVCFTDIFLRHTSSKTVLCIMPINTLQNWVAEFNMWLPLDASASPLGAHGEVRTRNFPIYVLNDSHKTLQMRAKVVKDWTTTGGVLMIGYELYRLLSMKKDKKPRKKKKAELKAEAEREKEKEREREEKKNAEGINEDTQSSDVTKMSEESKADKDEEKAENTEDARKEDTPVDEDKKLLDEMYEALVKPGPDLVICDEGHRIKNSHSNISYALKQMRTKRRVVLTGYPLQNNLLEYWCMVDFVRPNYLGSKTEFCNMFERPIQNGQCIDSTPQDIRLMRYRAHVLHSLLVGFVQRRSHAVLQSTLPQKEEYVMLVRMTPLQRKLYERFMNEVVRSTSVPNPLKAFAICCKIWNHPDVLYNFLKKRSEVNAAIEEDLDLEEIGGVTKAGRARNNKAQPKRAAKTRGAPKKPAATIPPNQTTGAVAPRQDPQYGGPNASYRPDPNNPNPYPYPGYQNQPFYPPNQPPYNQNYDSSYYQQPYNNYPNQYPQNNPEQGYNQNYWGNQNYYPNQGYYNNPQYPPGQTPQDFRGNPPDYNSTQQFPPNYQQPPDQPYPGNAMQPYQGANQEGYNQRPPYPGYNQQGYEFNQTGPSGAYPNNAPNEQYPNQPYPYSNNPSSSAYPNNPPYNQFENQPQNYPGYPNNVPNQTEHVPNAIKTEPNYPNDIKPNMPNYPVNDSKPVPNYPTNEVKQESQINQNSNVGPGYGNPQYGYPPNVPYPEQPANGNNSNYGNQYPNYPQHLVTKTPLGSGTPDSPLPTWPITELKTEIDKLKAEEKAEIKSESDGEVKIEDLDTKKIVKDDYKKSVPEIAPKEVKADLPNTPKKDAKDGPKSDASESEEEPEKPRRGRKPKAKDNKKADKKAKSKGKPKGRKDRKTSKEKDSSKEKDGSDSEDSEKEEKMNREEALALVKKAEEMTYDWATELLKDYIPGIIENSAKMDLFFYILTESIKLGDRLLLFSQSLFTLNLIEDFLERNYIPGTNCLWERNTNYYRLDGSTHALEREKLINEFNANPNIYLFLVSTRAGSLGINLVGANRVIVFDASWNPCHDTQAVCRVYRYGQKKPCFVYRFVMDCCLEKKIYDRQINKQGMADRVVDECNPDAVLSMKEITNLCFDNDDKETEAKDLSEHKDKYIDVVMQGIIAQHGRKLSKEPFQHESLLVDRKEKKLSSAEKRLAQRGYELEKKAASGPKPPAGYRTVRAADGSVVQRPVASVRPTQHAARWIPADVWRRQGMTAQEMTLPLDVVIPTNSAEKTNIVLKAGQRVMVLKSPKGIYMQLESGKIIAIKTSFKGLGGQKPEAKDSPVGKKVLGRPTGIPGSLKNNSAITITSKTGPRPAFQRVMSRPGLMGQKLRPAAPGQKIAEIRNRLGELRSYNSMRSRSPLQQGRPLRPNLPGSVSITKIPKNPKQLDNENSDSNTNKMELESEDEDTQVLDSDDETKEKTTPRKSDEGEPSRESGNSSDNSGRSQPGPDKADPIVLTTDEKLPSEEALESRNFEEMIPSRSLEPSDTEQQQVEKKINLLKNYRHQRQVTRPPSESSLTQLERTAIALNKEGMPDFRKNLDDITQSYSPTDEKPKSKKKRSPSKGEAEFSQPSMSHSVSSMLGPNKRPDPSPPRPVQATPPRPPEGPQAAPLNLNMSHGTMISPPPPAEAPPPAYGPLPHAQDPAYAHGQYPPGYGMGYSGYPGYYGGYAGGYYPPPYGPPAPPYTPPVAPHPPPTDYLPPNPQW